MNKETKVKVPVLQAPALKSSVPVVVGVISMAELNERYVIPHRDFKKQVGYQRQVNANRVRKLAKELLRGNVDLPTSVLLNVREEDFTPIKNIVVEHGHVFLETEGPFYVVDGQHRIEAIQLLFNQDPNKWGDYKISFICMLGASWEEELRQFYVVNSNSKSVPTDLALDLLSHQAANNPKLRESLEENNLDWKVRAQALTAELNNSSVMWRGLIRFAGQESGDRVGSVITNTGMVTSLKPLMSIDKFASQPDVSKQVAVIDAYWQAVKNILPDAFDDEKRAKYGIQKQTGAVVLHGVFVRLFDLVSSSGRSATDPASYEHFLSNALLGLDGDNAAGETVSGADFWLNGFEGAAGSYSSAGGQRVLTNRIKSELEVPDIN
jgi:DGQHR domain-containing protein